MDFKAFSHACASPFARQILPGTKTVIGLAFRVLRGIYRGIEEGSTYYQYTTSIVLCEMQSKWLDIALCVCTNNGLKPHLKITYMV